MAVGTFELYTRNFGTMRMDDLIGADVRLALLTSAYTPDYDESTGHRIFSDVSANEIAAGNGYTAGGVAIANEAKTAIANGFKFESDPFQWVASGGAIPAHRYPVMYVVGTLWGLVNPLIGSFIGDDTPGDIPATADGNTLRYNCPANGWWDET